MYIYIYHIKVCKMHFHRIGPRNLVLWKCIYSTLSCIKYKLELKIGNYLQVIRVRKGGKPYSLSSFQTPV